MAASNILSLVDALSSAKLNCIEYFNFFTITLNSEHPTLKFPTHVIRIQSWVDSKRNSKKHGSYESILSGKPKDFKLSPNSSLVPAVRAQIAFLMFLQKKLKIFTVARPSYSKA